jgi:hypothetical protein
MRNEETDLGFDQFLVAFVLILVAVVVNVMPGWTIAQVYPGMANAAVMREPSQPRLNVSGTAESVDTLKSTVRVAGTSETILVTPATRFAGGLTFASLKAGLDVKIIAVAKGEGKVEALEVSMNS